MSDKEVISALHYQNQQLTNMVLQLSEQLDQLQAENKRLNDKIAKLTKNSSNSSKPPSSDEFTKPPGIGKRSGGRKRKKGGQKGHGKHTQKMFPVEEVDKFIPCEIPQEEIDRRQLQPLDEYETFQQVELKDKPFFVTQYDRRKYRTRDGSIVLASLPIPVMRTGYFGNNLQALVGLLKGAMSSTYSQIQELLQSMGIPCSRGYLSKICTEKISDSLQEPYDQAISELRNEETLGSDESGFKNNGLRHWAWCLRATLYTVFHINRRRSTQILIDILGPAFAGVLMVDYFSSNKSFIKRSSALAQYCWAHLIRDIKYISDTYSGKTHRWAEALLDICKKMFHTLHRKHQLTPDGYLRSMYRWRDAFVRKVRRPPDAKEAQNIAVRFKGSPAEDYFRFIDTFGVEPTNNLTEQRMRHVAMDRRVTQGTRSEKGQRWCERIWSVVASCRQQGRSPYEYLKSALTAYVNGDPVPGFAK